MTIIRAANAGLQDELNFIRANNPVVKSADGEKRAKNFEETSEIKLVFLGMIRLYQIFISSQQNNQSVCTFTPSCSRFGFAAIKTYGPFYGVLMTSDRLLRCHGFSRGVYPIHKHTGKFSDPIELYYLGPASK
ncbi:membrane protein insertion efficiency factor YidD [candidate division KSB1 bacterium]|nr:membrane protein insertion efficiency factor YidD [candidate division KSB1 bacterium]